MEAESMSQGRSRVLKFVIIGDGGVGKTTLTKVFCTGQFIDQIMTIGIDIHTKDSIVKGERVTLQIWDISGQIQFKFLLPDFIRNANGVILAFDCTSNTSFLNLKEWLQLIRSKEPNAPIFLIATKIDEEYDPILNIDEIRVFKEAQGLIGFEETSAKLNLNVEIPFKRLLEYIYQAKPDEIPISFIGFEERSDYIESKISIPQEPDIITEIAPNTEKSTEDLTNSLNQPLLKEKLKSNNFITQCPHCNAPLRNSQIKLKADGKEVFCQNCMSII